MTRCSGTLEKLSASEAGRQALRARRRVLGALAAVPLLAGCGFTLRQPPRLHFRSIAFTGFAAQSPLAEALRREIGPQARVLDAPAQAELVLHSLVDKRERSVVASTAAAQVRELQLRLAFEFRVHTPSGRELVPRARLLLTRDMSYTEAAALAKGQEEADLFRDMQADVVAQVLRRLAAIEVSELARP